MKKGFPKGHPDLELPLKYYDQLYQKSVQADPDTVVNWQSQSRRMVQWYPALVLVEPPVLDFGCGMGQFAMMCRDYGIEYAAGIDYSPTAIKIARKHVPSAKFAVGSTIEGSYRTAIFLEVLEHVWKDLDLLKQVPKGRIIVASVPNFHTYGHVRWFENIAEVKKRYSQVIDIERVILEQSKGTNRWFTFKGVKK